MGGIKLLDEIFHHMLNKQGWWMRQDKSKTSSSCKVIFAMTYLDVWTRCRFQSK